MPPIFDRARFARANFDSSDAVSLRQLLPRARFLGGNDIQVAAIATDVRHCQAGDTFVALVDAERDGHEDVAEAIRRGASSVLAERLVPATAPTCIVRDTRYAHGLVCHALSGQPSEQLRTVGVTGSNGKTVTAHLLASILRAAKLDAGLMSNLSAVAPFEPPRDDSTPTAVEIAHSMHRMTQAGQTHAVLEVSSASLAARRTAGVLFDAAVITNIRRDHADEHGSIHQYRRLKSRLLEQLKPGGFAVINADDPASQLFLQNVKQPVLTFGMRDDAEISAEVLERQAWEQTFLLQAGPEAIPVCTRMIGDHHVYNCLAAAAVAITWGIDLDTIVRGLESVDKLPGRLERLDCGQPFHVFVDSARTPDSLAASLKAVRQVTRGRVICVAGAQGEQAPELRPQLGRVIEKLAHVRVLTNDNPREEAPLEIVHGILDGFQQPGRALVRPDRYAAITWALGQARPGDAVVIAGKGESKVQEVGARRLDWDDRAIAKQWLYNSPVDEPTSPAGRPILKIFG